MIKYVCDVCNREENKENCFIFNEGSLLCLACFYKNQLNDVEIYKRDKIFTYNKNLLLEDFFILLDKTKPLPSNDYKPFKIEKLKDIWLDNCFQAIIILNGSCLYPNLGDLRVKQNPITY